MSEEEKVTDFYARLKSQLEENTVWPSLYLYKFIVPSDRLRIVKIEDTFTGLNAKINTRESSKGSFTSISIEVIMKNPNHVIEKYLEVSKVDGVISL